MEKKNVSGKPDPVMANYSLSIEGSMRGERDGSADTARNFICDNRDFLQPS